MVHVIEGLIQKINRNNFFILLVSICYMLMTSPPKCHQNKNCYEVHSLDWFQSSKYI